MFAYLTPVNVDELLRLVSGVSVQRARELLAAQFARPDVAATIRRLPEPRVPSQPSCLPGLLPSASKRHEHAEVESSLTGTLTASTGAARS
jgi:hypothetical protein